MDGGSGKRFRLQAARAQPFASVLARDVCCECIWHSARRFLGRRVASWARAFVRDAGRNHRTADLERPFEGQETEAFYWLAIIFLRAGATNVGDGLTHIFGLSFSVASLLTALATPAAGFFTLPPSAGAISPLIDLRYWLAMGLGGVFGTVFGDLTAHTFGMFPALIALGLGLIVVIFVRGALAPTSMLGYWCIVLAERAAGTPAGDWFASRRGLGLGLPVALLCAGTGLIAALWLYRRTQKPTGANAFL
jgi:uncharacterized membrane-anchored protein